MPLWQLRWLQQVYVIYALGSTAACKSFTGAVWDYLGNVVFWPRENIGHAHNDRILETTISPSPTSSTSVTIAIIDTGMPHRHDLAVTAVMTKLGPSPMNE